jgi:hypothetical protein
MNKVRTIPLVFGGFWLAVAVWVVFSDVILRETRIGVVAQFLDKVPPSVGKPIFLLSWAILLLGWMVPVGFVVWPLLRKETGGSQNAVVTLTPGNELIVWIVCTCAAGLAFLTSHTFYVTAGTFVSGAPLLGITAFLFWMRFRRRQAPRTKSLTVTSNTALALLSIVAVLYLLGVATWYE